MRMHDGGDFRRVPDQAGTATRVCATPASVDVFFASAIEVAILRFDENLMYLAEERETEAGIPLD